ncbi:hypothetical protein HNP52_000355 [Sphingomonas kyeonggiensis]|uniref:DUF4376 domain-containing protein n=1 Tax=Sphingomonas kyeonggiensis TaxID=1268553 RepID=A0A7W7NR75_9SPHN|nr:DUF4376 domain-containing protein [Sphingomonas kyeonggiensis]MBB4837304.1 hypothetical protein [Sphingomonas kyeonggiensis]
MTWWMVRDRATGEEQLVSCDGPYAPYDGDLFELAELEHELDLTRERWDWELDAVVLRATPEQARNDRWEAAKVYREQRRNAPLPIMGVLAGDVIIADCDLESRLTIAGAVQMATLAQAANEPYSLTFTDHDNRQHTLDAGQVIALGVSVATFQGLCHAASQSVRNALDTAVAEGATAAEILLIDITAGYPEPPEAGDPPTEPES